MPVNTKEPACTRLNKSKRSTKCRKHPTPANRAHAHAHALILRAHTLLNVHARKHPTTKYEHMHMCVRACVLHRVHACSCLCACSR